MKKNKNGITLIALVITIIVLLILAGISISLVTGQNGVLTRAEDASNTYSMASAKEQANMRAAGYVSEYTEKVYVDNDSTVGAMTAGEYVLDKINGEEDGDYSYSVSGSTITVTSKTTGETLASGTVDDNGGIAWSDTVASGGNTNNNNNQNNGKVTIKVGNTNIKEISDLTTIYGETTDYTSVDNVQWQLFYDDDSYIYLIASDYVPNSILPITDNNGELIKSKSTTGNQKDYCASFATIAPGYGTTSYNSDVFDNLPWNKGLESNTITDNLQTNTYLKWVNSSVVNQKDNKNLKALAYMMDINKWRNFAGNAEGAYAIGGPTLEMFVQSYNAKHDTKLGTYEVVDSTNSTEYGYWVKIGTGSWQYFVRGLDQSGTDGNMWVKTREDKAIGYYISSPINDESPSERGMHIGVIDKDGDLTSVSVQVQSNLYMQRAFRPLVAIPKSSLK